MNIEYNKLMLSTKKFNDFEFEELITSSLSDLQYIYLSSNPFLSQQHIEYLFLQNIDAVNINLLRNKNCSKNRINEFLTFKDKIYNIAIAHNQCIDINMIQQLLDFDDKDVTMSLKLNNSI